MEDPCGTHSTQTSVTTVHLNNHYLSENGFTNVGYIWSVLDSHHVFQLAEDNVMRHSIKTFSKVENRI